MKLIILIISTAIGLNVIYPISNIMSSDSDSDGLTEVSERIMNRHPIESLDQEMVETLASSSDGFFTTGVIKILIFIATVCIDRYLRKIFPSPIERLNILEDKFNSFANDSSQEESLASMNQTLNNINVNLSNWVEFIMWNFYIIYFLLICFIIASLYFRIRKK